MRILYFSPRDCWPLTTGARIRDYHLARHLATHASLTYAALSAPGSPQPAPLPEGCGFQQIFLPRDRPYSPLKLIGGLLGPIPVTIRNYTSRRGAAALEQLLRQHDFDTVQIEGVHLSEYVPVIRRAAPRAVILADWHNVESELMDRYADTASSLPRRLFARRTARLIARSEDRLLRSCQFHTVVSELEREKLLARFPGATVEVISNGVDLDAYRGLAPLPSTGSNFVFVGSMDYHANIDAVQWFAAEIWPSIAARFPQAKFIVVGRTPPPAIRNLASPRIEITGTVEDVRSYYRDALALLVPLRVGGGTRLKILEAMAAGVPVISSRLGAEGIPASDGRHLLFAESPADWLQSVARLIEDSTLRTNLATQGLALVEDQFGWSAIAARLFDLHKSSIPARI